ncbi:MAG: universal stress protein [Chitinophagaceae bacterium]
MEKLIVALDALNYKPSVVKFACYIARLTNSSLTGLFLEDHLALAGSAKPVRWMEMGQEHPGDESLSESHAILRNIEVFQNTCIREGVRSGFTRGESYPAVDLVSASLFADLVLLDATLTFSEFDGVPSGFVRDVMSRIKCPVIVTPESFDAVDEIVFTYDGHDSSVFAMKQFTYLFPEFSDKKVSLIHVNKDGEWQGDDRQMCQKWLSEHFSAIGIQVLRGHTEDRLFDFLFKRKNVFLVMGSYRRNSLSRFFRHSHADLILNTIPVPVFITHS